MLDDQILDQPMDEDDQRKHVMKNLAGGGKRFANYIIDVIVFYVIIILIVAGAGILSEDASLIDSYFYLFFYLGWVLYYWAFESLTGKTIGKYVTRTRIVKEDGSAPESMNVLGRSFCRLIPFDAFSYLGTPGKGWHDSIPKIYVINE